MTASLFAPESQADSVTENKGLPLTFTPISMKGQEVERVRNNNRQSSHFSGERRLQPRWKKKPQKTKKGRQPLALHRKKRSFNTSQRALFMVYRSLTESVLTFNIMSWCGKLSLKQRNKLAQIISQTSKIIGHKQLPLREVQAISGKAIQIYQDPTHPLHSAFKLLPSGRWLRVPEAQKKKKGYTKSFISFISCGRS